MKRTARAFTMVELLTVVAITAILLTIIVLPIFQSFNFTRTAQGFTEAQSKARIVSSRIAREVGNAALVRDNSGAAGALTLVVPNDAGTLVTTTLPYLKIDLIKPAGGEPQVGPGGQPIFVDPNTGKVDPTLRAPKGQVVLPVTPGQTVVRYFVGLNRPFNQTGTNAQVLSYTNPYDGLLTQRTGERDNLFVLYRAEVEPFRWVPGTGYVGDRRFFEVDINGNPILDDPTFFTMIPGVDYTIGSPVTIRQLLDTNTAVERTKAERIANWKKRATIVTEVSRFDMILPVFDRRTRVVVQDNRPDFADATTRNRPRILPLVQFRPARVSSDPADTEVAMRLGEETDSAERVAPESFTARYGGWSNTILRIFPEGYQPNDPARNTYVVGRPVAGAGPTPDMTLFVYDPDSGLDELSGGQPYFNLSQFRRLVASQTPNALSLSLLLAYGTPGVNENAILVDMDERRGKIMAGFDSEAAFATADPLVAPVGTFATPITDTSTDWQNADGINQRFARAWNAQPNLRLADGSGIHRFVDLRQGGSIGFSPLMLSRSQIVPGSEEVFGPDQNPGPNFGERVRYTRTTRNPGPNQYRINYTDLPEPDYSLFGLPNPPPTYSGTNFVSAIFQPRFRAGYLQLNSDPNVPLPQGQIEVRFRVSFTRPGDVVAVDYDTRQLMEVQLTIRNYPQSTLPNPETITMRATANVRNFLR